MAADAQFISVRVTFPQLAKALLVESERLAATSMSLKSKSRINISPLNKCTKEHTSENRTFHRAMLFISLRRIVFFQLNIGQSISRQGR